MTPRRREDPAAMPGLRQTTPPSEVLHPSIAGGADSALGGALAAARRGWPVFPCRPGSKVPLTPHGFKDATVSPEVIRGWWSRWPDANVAVATGAPGPDVLDVDIRGAEGGWPSLNRLARAKLFTAGRLWVATPSGGRHLYFEGTEQRSGSLPALHLDFKAVGGYVLVPPSIVNGRAYEVRVNGPVAGALDWPACKALLAPPRPVPERRSGQTTLAILAGWLAGTEHGNHNHALFWAANRAIDNGIDPEGLIDAAVASGHDEGRARRTVASALRRRTGR